MIRHFMVADAAPRLPEAATLSELELRAAAIVAVPVVVAVLRWQMLAEAAPGSA